MANPSKPSVVKVDKLQTVLETLQRLQEDISKPPPGSWDGIGTSIETDLKQGDKGLQGNAAHIAGQRYYDNVYYIHQNAWSDVTSGVNTLISLLQTTIAQHSGTDSDVADAANRTNTTQQPTAPKTVG